MQATFWERALAQDFERAIGPAFQGCLDPARFANESNGAVRPVEDSDGAAIDELRAACGEDWNMPDNATLWRHA
jgi:hypothetical protein